MSRRDINDLIRKLEGLGCTVEYRKGSGHWQVTRPGCTNKVSLPSTPGDIRSVLNARSKLRRYLGVEL